MRSPWHYPVATAAALATTLGAVRAALSVPSREATMASRILLHPADVALETACWTLAALALYLGMVWFLAALVVLGDRAPRVLAAPVHLARSALGVIAPRTLRALAAATVAASIVGGAATATAADPPPVSDSSADAESGPVRPSGAPTMASPAPAPEAAESDRAPGSTSVQDPSPVQDPAAVRIPAAPVVPAAVPAVPTVSATPGLHVVHEDESLWSITADVLGPAAHDAEIASAWPLLYDANRHEIGEDPNRIDAGQRLVIPALTVPPADITAQEES